MTTAPRWEFADDDPRRADVLVLIGEHLAQMRAQSPAESVHAVDIDALCGEDVRFFTARSAGELGGMAAYRRTSERDAEVKSMRTTDAARGQGVGRSLLRHLMASARHEGIATLWLETGSTDGFRAARRLYESEGFSPCGPFGEYREDPESVFFRRDL